MSSSTQSGDTPEVRARRTARNREEIPASIYLLADHLDAALAAGEDLLKLSVELDDPTKSDGASPVWENLRDLVAAAGDLELTIMSRTLQARTRARDVAQYDDEIAPVLTLFSASTTLLADAAAELADRTFADFDGGTDPLAFLRSRGVIPADAGSLKSQGRLEIGEDFLIGRRVPLGPLLDITARLIDMLEASYGLFAAPEADPARSGDDRGDGAARASGEA